MSQQEIFWKEVDIELKNAKANHRCNICGNFGTAIIIKKIEAFDWSYDFPGDLNLRESLTCIVCGSNSRARMLILLLGTYLGEADPLPRWKNNRNLKILETPGLWPHPKFLKEKFDYDNVLDFTRENKKFPSSYFSDLEKLNYPTNTFDYVLSSDALEHIRNDDSIIDEIHRILKRNGKFLLQVPYCNNWNHTYVKVKTENEKDIFLVNPEYHADNSLVYRIYGKDLLDRLKQIGFSVEYIHTQVPQFMISLQPIIVCTKSIE